MTAVPQAQREVGPVGRDLVRAQRERRRDRRPVAAAEAAQKRPGCLDCIGGQRQRISIARALALDVTLRGRILDLLLDLQPRLGLSYLLISHDLGVVRYCWNRVAVMWRGGIVGIGPTAEACRRPAQPYTQRLMAAVPEARVA